MKKLLLLVVLLLGCANTYNQTVPCESGGALCQGSRAWKQHNFCESDHKFGPCIEAVRGPFVLTGMDSSEHCPNGFIASVSDTFRNDEVDSQWTVESREQWHMAVPSNTRLWVQNIAIEIPAGQSLFVGTDGFNDVNRSGQCWITWEGHVP